MIDALGKLQLCLVDYCLICQHLFIGIENLCNVRPGDYYGIAKMWSNDKRLDLGAILLYR